LFWIAPLLSPLLRRGERKKKRLRKSLSNMHEPSSLDYEFLGTNGSALLVESTIGATFSDLCPFEFIRGFDPS